MVIDKNEMLMIGDASGKSGQFSDSDKKTAENYGIDYMDIEDFKRIKRGSVNILFSPKHVKDHFFARTFCLL